MNRDDFLEIVYDELRDDSTNDRANRIIDAFDSVDAVPIRHGKWIYPYESLDINECSLCGFTVQDKISNVPLMFKYCPNCGAKMDGGEAE